MRARIRGPRGSRVEASRINTNRLGSSYIGRMATGLARARARRDSPESLSCPAQHVDDQGLATFIISRETWKTVVWVQRQGDEAKPRWTGKSVMWLCCLIIAVMIINRIRSVIDILGIYETLESVNEATERFYDLKSKICGEKDDMEL
ncbi:hypothetical protein K440DRAFT_681872 [Wilcoxina mikolae CBS 423.85]|nr:hypothetical protein K440DRAFT_681872 [Wilcoxina mikolae CBS 423.85]